MKLRAFLGVTPGTVAYRMRASALMPLEVCVGQAECHDEKDPDDPWFESVYWKPGQTSNGFFLVLGASGSGKTETLKVIGAQILEHGIPLLVLDFHGDVVVPWLRSELLSSGMDSRLGINPMELDSRQAREVGLYDQRVALLDLIGRAIPHLSHHQRNMLGMAMARAYEAMGIHDEVPWSWERPAPVFEQVLDILQEWLDDEAMKSSRPTIRSCIAAVQAVFGHPVFGRQCWLSMEEILACGLRVDLSKVPDSVRYIVADTLLRKLFRRLMLQGPIPVAPASDLERFRLFIMIDEAKILSAATGRPNASDLILNLLVTEGRKFGIGLILASQMSEHFGSEVRANAATWLVLRPMDQTQAKRNADDIQVKPADLLQLKGKGDGYYRTQTTGAAFRMQVGKLHTREGNSVAGV